jgi:hypothetical protein
MSEVAVSLAHVPRVAELTVEAFVSEYLQKNRPVIVTDAMAGWSALQRWTPENLTQRFGNERVQIYGDLFRLADIKPLSEYFSRYFGRDDFRASGSTPYVRWYCHLIGDERVPWADDIFTRISEDWQRPAFFPSNSFLLPFCAGTGMIDPAKDWFPARGLFISARGARTRLHADPWASDALLCQVYGEKDFVMYDPSQGPYLMKDGRSVDVEDPDLKLFPDFPKARIAFRDTLRPGEIVLVPAGWYHHFNSVSDSISLTWNFVHNSRRDEFLSYLAGKPGDVERKQLRYAYFESPGHRTIEDPQLANAVAALRP